MSLTSVVLAVPKILSQVCLAASRERGSLRRQLEGIRDRLEEHGQAELLSSPSHVAEVVGAVEDVAELDRVYDLHIAEALDSQTRGRVRVMKSPVAQAALAAAEAAGDAPPRRGLLSFEALREARSQVTAYLSREDEAVAGR